MLIKDLITQLTDLYNSYDQEYKDIMGEPSIEIDIFGESPEHPHLFNYKGFSPNIRITPSSDGIYNILTAFEEK